MVERVGVVAVFPTCLSVVLFEADFAEVSDLMFGLPPATEVDSVEPDKAEPAVATLVVA